MKKNELALGKTLQKELEKEIAEDYKKEIREHAKELMKNIRRTELLLESQRKELKELMEGKGSFKEEDFLFN